MKKSIFLASLLLAAVFTFNSCEKNVAPREITESYCAAMEKGDYEKAITVIMQNSVNPLDENKPLEYDKQSMEVVAEMFEKEMQENGGLESCKIVSEKTEGNETIIRYEFVYKNGRDSKEKFRFKQINGKWKLTQ